MDAGTVLDKVPFAAFGGALALQHLPSLIRIDHPMTMNFAVDIDGFTDSGFVSAEGLHDRTSPYEIKQVHLSTRKKVFPYRRNVGMVTLEKGVTFRGKMEEWYYECENFHKGGSSPLKDVSIVQLYRVPKVVPYLGGQLIEVIRWTLPNCVCRDLTFPKYRARRGKEISILQCVIDCTTPNMVQAPSDFGDVGYLLDALMK